VAVNKFGESLPSKKVIIGFGAKPTAPTSPLRDSAVLRATSMQITWTRVTTADLPVLGYVLMRDDGLGGEFIQVYDGSKNPQLFSVSVNTLISPRTYRFKVYAVDVNGGGVESSTSSFIACVVPSNLAIPILTAVEKQKFTVHWSMPKNFGGCVLTGYELWRDDGTGGTINIAIDASTIANQPALFKH